MPRLSHVCISAKTLVPYALMSHVRVVRRPMARAEIEGVRVQHAALAGGVVDGVAVEDRDLRFAPASAVETMYVTVTAILIHSTRVVQYLVWYQV